MKKLIFILLIISTLSCKENNNWIDFKDEKENFSISFPDKPMKKKNVQFFKKGQLIWNTYKYISVDNNQSFSIKYCDLPNPNINSNSLKLINYLTKMTQRELYKEFQVSQRISVTQINKYPGREYLYEDRIVGNGCISRCFIVKSRLYMLEVRYDLKNRYNKYINVFFDSFKLLSIEENKNPEIKIKYPEKNFELDFPEETTVRKIASILGHYGKLGTVMEAFDVPKNDRDAPNTKNIFYGINYIQLPPTINSDSVDLVKKLIYETVKAKGKIINKKEIKIANCWGLESHIKMSGVPAIIHEKAFVIKDKFYRIGVISYQGKENNKEANDFLNSFRLKK